MKISAQKDYGLNPVAGPVTPSAGSGSQGVAASGDQVELSAHGQELQRLTAQIAALPEPASPRFAEVMRQLQDGSYNVPSEDVAASIVQRATAGASCTST